MSLATRRRTSTRWVLLAIVVGMVAMWAYIFWFQLSGRGEPLNRLDDPTWSEGAELICAPVHARVFALPQASEFEDKTPQDRAVVVDQVTDLLDAQLTDLHELAQPASAKDRSLVAQWMEDWDVYQDSRRAHADRLTAGDDPRFAILSDVPVDGRIDFFAETNHMLSCLVPGDI